MIICDHCRDPKAKGIRAVVGRLNEEGGPIEISVYLCRKCFDTAIAVLTSDKSNRKDS